MSKKIKVFLCYAKEDLEKVGELYAKLEQEGFDPWLDKEKILPGQKWNTIIKQAIKDSDFFIACLSNNSTTKDGYLNREISEAMNVWEEKAEGKIYLIPALLEPCYVPEKLQHIQWVDIFREKEFNKLLAALTGTKILEPNIGCSENTSLVLENENALQEKNSAVVHDQNLSAKISELKKETNKYRRMVEELNAKNKYLQKQITKLGIKRFLLTFLGISLAISITFVIIYMMKVVFELKELNLVYGMIGFAVFFTIIAINFKIITEVKLNSKNISISNRED